MLNLRSLTVVLTLCAWHFCVASVPANSNDAAGGGSMVGERFTTPEPAYPFLVYGDTHHWSASVAFDERGNASEATIIRSTGDAGLDQLISTWIRGHWKSHGGGTATLVTSAK